MVRTFFAAVGKEVRGMHEAAYMLAAFAFLSQILGLLRDRLLASSFGASGTLDVYYAAFRIPDLLFATVASLLSLYALLPLLSRLEREGKSAIFLEYVLLFFFAGMGVISLAAFIAAPYLVPLLVPGIASEELVALTRILLLQPILLGASNILASLTQLRHRFFLYSISPLLYNLGIILGIVLLYPLFGLPGLGWGVVLGALMHLMVQVPLFGKEPRAHSMTLREALRGTWEVLALSVPRTATLAAGQITIVILTAAASLLAPGSIAVFMFAFNLQAVPLAIIGVSYSVAAFPTLSRLFAIGEQAEFLRHIESALRHMLFWAIPATVFVIVLRAQLVRAILGAGAFDWEATRLTAAALALFIVSLVAQSVALLLARAYYAAGKTGKPFIFAAVSVGVAVGSAFALTAAFHASPLLRAFLESLLRVQDLEGTAVLMLAFGYALGALAQVGVGLYVFSREFEFSLRPLVRLAFQSFSASVIGGAVTYAFLAALGAVVNIDTLGGVVFVAAIAGSIGLMTVAAILVLLRNQEIAEVYAALHRRLWGAAPVAVEPTDVS